MGWKPYGTPLVSSILCDDIITNSDIQAIVQKMLSPMLRAENSGNLNSANTRAASQNEVSPDSSVPDSKHSNGANSKITAAQKLPLVFVDENNVCIDLSIGEDKALKYSSSSPSILVFIDWSKKLLKSYDTHYLENLPEVSKLGPPTKKARTEPLSLYTCLEAFLREEPLVPEDMWYVSYIFAFFKQFPLCALGTKGACLFFSAMHIC